VYGVLCCECNDECHLTCVAVRCSVLQCVAVCCSVLQCVAVYGVLCMVCCVANAMMSVTSRVLQCVAMCCSVLQCVAVYDVLCCESNDEFEVIWGGYD